MRRAALGIVLAATGCAKLPPPTRPPTHVAVVGEPAAKGEVGPLVRVGFRDDALGPEDGPVRKDGQPDFAFRVRLSGTVSALALINSDPQGHLAAPEIWDTIIGPTPYPKALGLPFRTGGETASLALVDAEGTLLNEAGSLSAHVFDGAGEIVTIYVADPWNNLREGRAFTLLVLRPDGVVDRSTVILV